ncbi:MAG: amino acid permease, partial [Candidatus Latescibacterota bacterium]
MAKRGSRRAKHTQGNLGTFAGVFTPSVLTILGIILFLRLGFVVGSAGLGRTLIIIGIANFISVLTSFSLATIATNLKVKGGGDYYLISRTLGVEFGGALGIVLFVAQSVSIAFYSIGFGEAIGAVVGAQWAWFPQLVAAGAVLALCALAWVGADAATRFQFVVMTVLGLALAGFFVGGLANFDGSIFRENWVASGDQPFWLIFAIFFPAVTGFTQGVSMSGDLSNPARSLPLGTFLAVGVSILVYFAVALIFAGTVPGPELVADYGAMRRVAVVPWLIDAGVIAATLSSALASCLGAPRILQSLARDRVFPRLDVFAAGHGPSENPRRGVLLSLIIAMATVALGNLNVIAPVVSMFFLISYGLLNFATYYESRAQSPSFRPTFRWHHPFVSLAGAIACGAVMLAIDPLTGAIAGVILFAILQYVRRTVRVSRWADSSRSARLQQIRQNLVGLSANPEHPRDWRPVIVAFSEDKERRLAILRFASWIEGGSGFVSLVHILDEQEKPPPPNRLRSEEEELQREIGTAGVAAFARIVFTYPTHSTLPVLLGAHGIGEIRANTVLVNRLEGEAADIDTGRRKDFAQQLRIALRSGCNLIVLDAEPSEIADLDATPVDRRRIDVWYRRDATGRLSLLLAYLMTRTPDWKDAEIRLIAPLPKNKTPAQEMEANLQAMLNEVRIEAQPV